MLQGHIESASMLEQANRSCLGHPGLQQLPSQRYCVQKFSYTFKYIINSLMNVMLSYILTTKLIYE